MSSARLAARRAVRLRVARHPLLRRGWYVAAGESLWRRVGAPVPTHLRHTKGWPSGLGPRGWLRRVALGAATPSIVWARGSGAFTLAAGTHEGGLVLLGHPQGRVAHEYGRLLGADYADLRSAFSRHLPAPGFTLEDGLLVEDDVRGRHLLDLDGATRLATVRDLVRRFASLTADEGAPGGAALLAAAVDAAQRADAPPALLDALDALAAQGPADTWRLVPAPAEATVKNVLVVGDHTPAPIDLSDLRRELFFSYPVGIVSESRPDVLAAFRAGALDDEFAALFAATGASWTWDSAGRDGLLAARLVVVAYQEHLRPDGVDLPRLGASLNRRWERLWSDRPAAYR